MFKEAVVSVFFVCVYFANRGDAENCYHCYETFNKTLTLGSFDASPNNSSLFVRCDKDKSKWNTWNCPREFPACVIMAASVKDHYEVVRSCSKKNFCADYVPPSDVKLDSCRECNTTLCNDYPEVPEPPPLGPGPLFTFNINIRLNLKKYPHSEQGLDEH